MKINPQITPSFTNTFKTHGLRAFEFLKTHKIAIAALSLFAVALTVSLFFPTAISATITGVVLVIALAVIFWDRKQESTTEDLTKSDSSTDPSASESDDTESSRSSSASESDDAESSSSSSASGSDDAESSKSSSTSESDETESSRSSSTSESDDAESSNSTSTSTLPHTNATSTSPAYEVGLPNTGNTCWLNATLQFLAKINCSELYDQKDDSVEQLRKALVEVIEQLQVKSKSGTVVEQQVYRKLLKEIRKQFPDLRIGRQNDAPEFLLALMKKLSINLPNSSYEMGTILHSLPDQLIFDHRPGIVTTGVVLELSFDHQHEQTFSLSDKAAADDERELRDLNTGANIKYRHHKQFTHLPERLLVYPKRPLAGGVVSRASMNYDVSATQEVKLFEYQTIYDNEGNIVDMTPHKEVFYRIEAAIYHSGTQYGGHYTCYTRLNDELFLHHNDAYVSKSRSGTEKSGYFYSLVKTREVDLRNEK